MTGLRWTPEQYAEYQRKAKVESAAAPYPISAAAPVSAGPKFKSKAEARYADILEAEKRAGLISDWGYEEVTLVVGKAIDMVTRLTPDFAVHHLDRSVELREVKGFMRDDARVKLLAAVKQWPGFKWTLVWAKKMDFRIESLN